MEENKLPQKRNKRIIIIVIGLLLFILSIGGIWWWFRSNRMVSTDDARVKGTITAVSAKVNGRIEKVFVKEGDHVEAGQIIAVIEKREFKAQVNQNKANLATAQAKLAETIAGSRPQEIAQANASVLQAKANLENADKNNERNKVLYGKGAISAQQRDSAQTEHNVAYAQYLSAVEQYNLREEGSRSEDVQMAQAQVEQAQAALDDAQIQLEETVIKAPVSGDIGMKSVEEGTVVASGEQLFSICDLADIWIEANVEETYIGRIKIGQYVEFTIDAYPDKKFIGQVIALGPAANSQFALLPTENSSANFTKVTQRLPVKIKVSESNYIFKPGMSAYINIYTK